MPIYTEGVQLGGFGGQLACSRAGANLEIIVSGVGGGGGSSLTDVFTECSNRPFQGN